ncbi:MAG: hypothetical protein AAGG51_24505 [Cyanobacteria bacterium P01_G01_bin.54]
MLRKPTPSLLHRLNIPSPWLFTGTVLISLGLHGVFLGLPLPEERPVNEPETPELDVLANQDIIQIIPLPDDSTGKDQAENQSAPSPPAADRPSEPAPPAADRPAQPTPSVDNALTTSTEADNTNRLDNDLDNNSVSQGQDTGNTGEDGGNTDPFSAFLLYDGAVQGSDGFFLNSTKDEESQHTDHSFADILATYQNKTQQDEFKDFTINPTIVEEGFFVVHEVTNQKNGEKNYLHLIEYNSKQIIVMFGRPQTLIELKTNQNFSTMTPDDQIMEKALANLNLEEVAWEDVNPYLPSNINSENVLLRGKIESEDKKNELLAELRNQDFIVDYNKNTNSYTLVYQSQFDFIQLYFVDLGNGEIALFSTKTIV